MVPDPRSVDALLETIDAETRDTLAGAPHATLRPKASHDTARRALEVLGQLAGASPTASLQLRPGDEIARGGMGVIRTPSRSRSAAPSRSRGPACSATRPRSQAVRDA